MQTFKGLVYPLYLSSDCSGAWYLQELAQPRRLTYVKVDGMKCFKLQVNYLHWRQSDLSTKAYVCLPGAGAATDGAGSCSEEGDKLFRNPVPPTCVKRWMQHSTSHCRLRVKLCCWPLFYSCTSPLESFNFCLQWAMVTLPLRLCYALTNVSLSHLGSHFWISPLAVYSLESSIFPKRLSRNLLCLLGYLSLWQMSLQVASLSIKMPPSRIRLVRKSSPVIFSEYTWS